MDMQGSAFCCTLVEFGSYNDLYDEKNLLTKEILEDLYIETFVDDSIEYCPQVLTTTYLENQDQQYGISKVLEECGFEIREIPRKPIYTKKEDKEKLYFAINTGLWPSLIERIKERYPNNEDEKETDSDVPF